MNILTSASPSGFHYLRASFALYLLASAFFLAFSPAAFAQNLILNGNFEAIDGNGMPEHWSVGKNPDAFSVERGNAPTGNTSLRARLNGVEAMCSQTRYIKLEPGKVYTLSAYVKSENLAFESDGTMATSLRIQVINLGWSYGGNTALKVIENTDWTRYSQTFIVPPAERFRYQGKDNTDYKVVFSFNNLSGDIWIDGVQLEEGKEATPFSEAQVSVDPVQAADVAENAKSKGPTYPQISDPLFTELQGTEKMTQPLYYYGWSDTISDIVMRPFAKRFAHRFSETEERAEIGDSKAGFVVFTSGGARGGSDSYPTMRQIFRPDAQGISPAVMKNDWPWTMDARFLRAERDAAKTLATKSLDSSPGNAWGNTCGLMMGDERFESRAIKAPPKEKWYEEVQAADEEVRQQFGFGKYGIPDSDAEKDPFKRIAHRRWANAKLLENMKLIADDVRAINPKLALMAPIIAGGVPSLDVEEASKYLDLFCNQSWSAPSTYVQMFATGADTKALVDLCGRPVIAFPQHASARDPEAVREQFSQALRNGASGITLLTTEWYDRELEHVKYINTAKWEALREMGRAVAGMHRLKFPEADTAILFASNTYLTFDTPKMANREFPQVYSNYVALGPETRSWFKFVSDRQIERQEINLSDYKILYLPLATYQSPVVLDALKRYVEEGGVLIAADPTAFTWNINGERLDQQWSELTGVTFGEPRDRAEPAKISRELPKAEGLQLRLPKPALAIKPNDSSVKPLATFADGSLAATIRQLGKGRVIAFGANPFDTTDRSPSAYQLTTALQEKFGARTGQDIWRFKLPPFQDQSTSLVDGKCLTGNFVKLSQLGPVPDSNLDVDGVYRYDTPPDGSADARADGWISFREGKLTNRVQAYQKRTRGGKRGPSDPSPWIVSFQKQSPVKITFDLKKPFALRELRLFYSGVLPALEILGSNDGEEWHPLGSHPAQPVTEDVLDMSAALSGQYRFLQLAFSERESPRPFELAEVEIWDAAGSY